MQSTQNLRRVHGAGKQRSGNGQGLKRFGKQIFRHCSAMTRKAGKAIGSAFVGIRPFLRAIVKKLGGREKAAQAALLVVKSLAFTVFTFFIAGAEFPLGIYPLGIAMVCAANCEMSFFAFLGSAAACILYGHLALPYFAVNFLLYITRRSFTDAKFGESRIIRSVEAAGCGLFLGCMQYFFSGYLVYDLLAGLALVCTSALAAYLYCGLFDKPAKNAKDPYFEASLCAAAFTLLFAIKSFAIAGVSVSFLLSGVLTLFAARAGGVLYGGAAGLLCGLACGNAAAAPMLGFGGMLAGLLAGRSVWASLVLFFFASAGVGVYTSSTAALTNEIPALLIAVLAVAPFYKRVPFGRLSGYDNRPVMEGEGKESLGKNLDGLSNAFSSLSQVFFKLSDKMRYPAPQEVKSMIARTFDKTCSSCSMQKLCYGRDSTDKDELFSVVYHALSEGTLAAELLPESLRERCMKCQDIVQTLSDEYKNMTNRYFKDNKTEILAAEYSAMARMIKCTAEKSTTDTVRDTFLELSAAKALKKAGIEYTEILAFGARKKILEVYGVTIDRITCSAKHLADYLSGQCGLLLDEPEFVMRDNCYVMRFCQGKKFDLEYSQAALAKGDETVNGDSVSFFENDEGYFYALISDGMGSGREAALTSRLTSVFIEKLLTTGAQKGVTFELLNNLLLAKNDECFATVDLLEADLLNGQASFIKAGAAPAYVIRATKLYKITSATPPAGIIQGFSAENTRFDLEDGDIILMLSDGIVASFDDSPWLNEIIRFNVKDDPALLASRIIEKAKEINTRPDDMTVVAAKVKARIPAMAVS